MSALFDEMKEAIVGVFKRHSDLPEKGAPYVLVFVERNGFVTVGGNLSWNNMIPVLEAALGVAHIKSGQS